MITVSINLYLAVTRHWTLYHITEIHWSLELNVLAVPGNEPARVLHAHSVHNLHHLHHGELGGEQFVLGHALVVWPGEVSVSSAWVETQTQHSAINT